MKKYFAVLLFSIIGLGGAYAQKNASKERNNDKIDELISELKLDDEQSEKVTAIFDEYQTTLKTQKEIIKNSEKNIKVAKTAAKTAKEKSETQLKEVLTEEQYKKYQDMKGGQKDEEE
ncbi:MAG: hypothetical protein R2813_03145 [Flavobacteriales bacterium]